jgi:hypothetical protein
MAAMKPIRGEMDRRKASWVARRAERAGDDAGAALLLALLFLVAVGTVVGAMASWTSNDLNNTLVFQQQRNLQSALTTATNVAIQNIRYTPMLGGLDGSETLNASPPAPCWATTPTGSPSQVQAQGQTIDVWCSTIWNPTSAQTRVVTISSCLDVPADPNPAGDCAKSPALQTQVTFDDYSAANPTQSLAPCTAPPTGSCGAGMTINSSLRSISVSAPTVTALSSQSGFVTGGATLTLTGTNFQPSGMLVSFILASSVHNITAQGTNVTYISPTSMSVTIPAETTTGVYNVLVSDTNGISAASSASQYTYQPVAPVVTGATTSSGSATGSAAGGSTITITGSGFLDSTAGDLTTVEFVDTQNLNNVYTSPANSVALVPPSATVTAGTELTASTPAIPSTDMTYYVEVVTLPGGSSGTSGAPVFTYQPLLPLLASAVTSGGATQGPAGTTITITGVGFISGNTTVQMVPVSGGFGVSTLTLTGVTVTGSTTMTATIPSGGKSNTAYYVVATTPSGTSGTNSAPQFTFTSH